MDLLISANKWTNGSNEQFISPMFITSDVDKFCDIVKTDNIFNENDDIVFIIWKDAVMEKAYNVTASNYEQALGDIKYYFEKEKDCIKCEFENYVPDVCRNCPIKLEKNNE